MRQAGKCIHFNGIGNECCTAGVNYKELCGNAPSYGALIPCLGNKLIRQGIIPAVCVKIQMPTEVDIAEERMRKVGPLIARMKEEYKKKSGCRSFHCPACDVGTLTIAIAGSNGHTQGRCSTRGCVSWIE